MGGGGDHENPHKIPSIPIVFRKPRLSSTCLFFTGGGGTFGPAATTGLLYQPQMIVIVEKLVE
jgi:hypothetical protein